MTDLGYEQSPRDLDLPFGSGGLIFGKKCRLDWTNSDYFLRV